MSTKLDPREKAAAVVVVAVVVAVAVAVAAGAGKSNKLEAAAPAASLNQEARVFAKPTIIYQTEKRARTPGETPGQS